MDHQTGGSIFRKYVDYLIDKERNLLAGLYRPGSRVVRLDLSGVNRIVVEVAWTIPDIEGFITNWNFIEIVCSFSYWECCNHEIVVTAFGSLRPAAGIKRRKFTQTLIISRFPNNRYFITNDVLCFLGDEADESTCSSYKAITDNNPNSQSTVAVNYIRRRRSSTEPVKPLRTKEAIFDQLQEPLYSFPIYLNRLLPSAKDTGLKSLIALEGDTTSQREQMESAHLLESDSQNNADPSDESSAYTEIDSLTIFTKAQANDIRIHPVSTESEKVLDLKHVAVEQVQDQRKCNPENVTEVLPSTEETDPESLVALDHEMRIPPQVDGA